MVMMIKGLLHILNLGKICSEISSNHESPFFPYQSLSLFRVETYFYSYLPQYLHTGACFIMLCAMRKKWENKIRDVLFFLALIVFCLLLSIVGSFHSSEKVTSIPLKSESRIYLTGLLWKFGKIDNVKSHCTVPQIIY